MRKRRNNLGNKSYRKRLQPGHPIHEEYRRIRCTFAEEVRKAKTTKWVEYLEQATTSSVWDIGKMVEAAPTDGGTTRIPNLVVELPNHQQREARTNRNKEEVFRQTFFPQPPGEPVVPNRPMYPPPAWNFQPPSNRAILQAIQRMKNGKATKPGTLSNDFFKACGKTIVPHLGPIYRATFTLGVYSPEWSDTETIVLRKPGKPDYTKPGAWRPIVLSNGHGRLLNSCVANEVIRQVELKGLLPDTQFG
ncbi:hypothetical protein EV360DRAFT_43697, partial [Lentinula raphanica]